ncbi:MAG: hypothetical protein GF350_15300 [Chitinivibrionales bacterium]|nr:hypothetical protein [Chitinivibrionales bacterium]
MEDACCPQKNIQEHHDLDYLAGTWSEKEKKEFDSTLKKMRTIDMEMWK